MNPEVLGKQLQLLTDALPRLARVAVLSNPTTPTHQIYLREAEVAARSLTVQLQTLKARAPSEFADVFSTATTGRAGALIVLPDSMFFAERTRLAELAAKSRLPLIAPQREMAEAGYLMTYGINILDTWRRTALYVDKILRGGQACRSPCREPTKLELVVNLKTARALGLTIPQPVLLRADEVIE